LKAEAEEGDLFSLEPTNPYYNRLAIAARDNAQTLAMRGEKGGVAGLQQKAIKLARDQIIRTSENGPVVDLRGVSDAVEKLERVISKDPNLTLNEMMGWATRFGFNMRTKQHRIFVNELIQRMRPDMAIGRRQ